MKFKQYRQILKSLMLKALEGVSIPETIELNSVAEDILSAMENSSDLEVAMDRYEIQDRVSATLVNLERMGFLTKRVGEEDLTTNFEVFFKNQDERVRAEAAMREKPFRLVRAGGSSVLGLTTPQGEIIALKFHDESAGDETTYRTWKGPYAADEIEKIVRDVYLTRNVQSVLDNVVDALEMAGVNIKEHFEL